MSLLSRLFLLGLLLTVGAQDELLEANRRFYERECAFFPEKLWLDVVVLMDVSLGMTEEGLAQVLANVGTVFDPTTITQGEGHHSRVALVTYGKEAEIKNDLHNFTSTDEFLEKLWTIQRAKDTESQLKDGLMKAEQVFREGRANGFRKNVKEVIIIYASVYKEGHFEDAKQLADQIKISGKDIIVVAFDQGGKPNALDLIRKIATDGYFFMNTVPNLSGELQHSLCQINCFCKKQWLQYVVDTVRYGTCLRIGAIDANWNQAKRSCVQMGRGAGHLATVLDSPKHNFIANMFKNDYRMEQPYMYHIGLSYDKEAKSYFWEQPAGMERIPKDGSEWEKWNKYFPNESGEAYCVLTAQTSTSFELGWQNAHCRNVSKRYICQMNSCDTETYCPDLDN